MRGNELLRLVWLNITQNKFKAIMTSIGIIVGAATIVMVFAIGKGGQEDVADQFKNLNAGAIDISYEGTDSSSDSAASGGGGGMGAMPSGGGAGAGGNSSGGSSSGGSASAGGDTSGGFGGGAMGGGTAPDASASGSGKGGMGDSSGRPSMGGGMGGFSMFGGSSSEEDRINQEKVTLTDEDVDDITTFVSGITDATITYATKGNVDGGELDEETSYTLAGVESNYATISNLSMAVGEFISDSDEENKEKVCVIGATVAEEIFGSAIDAYGSVIYIEDRSYVVDGVLEAMGTVASGISPDDAIFIPYATGVKYITGTDVSPIITVLAEDVNNVDAVIEQLTDVLAESYPNTEFTYNDAGSKMEAASASNEILTVLLIAMAVIVFIVGGIGIMNVLFVSVKERTNEIGILKSIGCSRINILFEFLLEASAISFIGGVLGVMVSVAITPLVQYFGVRVELTAAAFGMAMVFAVFTGTIFGFYPAWKASKLVPVEALSAE